MSEFSPFGAEMRDMELATTKGRIKTGGPRPVTTARSAGSFKGFRALKHGVKPGEARKFCGRYPETLTPTTKILGSIPRKDEI